MHRIELARGVVKTLRRIPEPQRGRIEQAIAALGKQPRPAGVMPLTGRALTWRIRVGS